MLVTFAKGLVSGFQTLFLNEVGELRPKADVRRILACFDRPADIFTMQADAVAFLLSKKPDALTSEQYTLPYPCTVDSEAGTVIIPD